MIVIQLLLKYPQYFRQVHLRLKFNIPAGASDEESQLIEKSWIEKASEGDQQLKEQMENEVIYFKGIIFLFPLLTLSDAASSDDKSFDVIHP